MTKKPHSISTVSVLAVLFGILCWSGTLLAQSTPDTQPAPSQAQPAPDTASPADQAPAQQSPDQPSQPPSQAAPSGSQASPDAQAPASDSTAVKAFSGTVMKQGDKYVLKDASGTVYDLDHQDQVSKFEGKNVRVRGTLDPSGKMIHLQ